MPCRTLRTKLGLYPPGAGCSPSPSCDIKNISKHCQISPEEQDHFWSRITFDLYLKIYLKVTDFSFNTFCKYIHINAHLYIHIYTYIKIHYI